jgi:hypothetical protein
LRCGRARSSGMKRPASICCRASCSFTSVGAVSDFARAEQSLGVALARHGVSARLVRCTTQPARSMASQANALRRKVLRRGLLCAQALRIGVLRQPRVDLLARVLMGDAQLLSRQRAPQRPARRGAPPPLEGPAPAAPARPAAATRGASQSRRLRGPPDDAERDCAVDRWPGALQTRLPRACGIARSHARRGGLRAAADQCAQADPRC